MLAFGQHAPCHALALWGAHPTRRGTSTDPLLLRRMAPFYAGIDNDPKGQGKLPVEAQRPSPTNRYVLSLRNTGKDLHRCDALKPSNPGGRYERQGRWRRVFDWIKRPARRKITSSKQPRFGPKCGPGLSHKGDSDRVRGGQAAGGRIRIPTSQNCLGRTHC